MADDHGEPSDFANRKKVPGKQHFYTLKLEKQVYNRWQDYESRSNAKTMSDFANLLLNLYDNQNTSRLSANPIEVLSCTKYARARFVAH